MFYPWELVHKRLNFNLSKSGGIKLWVTMVPTGVREVGWELANKEMRIQGL